MPSWFDSSGAYATYAQRLENVYLIKKDSKKEIRDIDKGIKLEKLFEIKMLYLLLLNHKLAINMFNLSAYRLRYNDKKEL